MRRFKAFISYRHSDNGRRHAVALETALKRYAKPTLARPMAIFRDEKHMKPDISLPKLIRDGLENAEYLIFLAERASAESQWCCEELEYWCGQLKRTDKLIIVLIEDHIELDGTQRINFERTTALPRLLEPYLVSIPLYMDLRWAKTASDTDLQNSKYRHEINSLTARLRGLSPEDLNDEEIRVFRRNIRLRNGAIGVLFAMLLVSLGASSWALRAQKEAEAQKKIAEEKAIEARRQQQIAEDNLRQKIEQETQKERLNFDKYIGNGDVFANSGDFQIALRYYLKADTILRNFEDDPLLQSRKELLTLKLATAKAKVKMK